MTKDYLELLLRVTVLENLLIEKGILSVEEIQSTTNTIIEKSFEKIKEESKDLLILDI